MVTSAVHSGHAFAIMTPTLLLDAVVEGMEFDISELPAAGFRREITVVARDKELEQLPQQFADCIQKRLRDAIEELGPVCRSAITFEEGEPTDD